VKASQYVLKTSQEATMKHNPVAKFAHKANKATVQRDRTKYQRKQKHKGDGRQDRHRPFCWARVRALAPSSASPFALGAVFGFSRWARRPGQEFAAEM
jgi:hypothetical protein